MTTIIDGDTAPQANLEQLKNQAKSLLKQAKEGSSHAISRLARAKAYHGPTSVIRLSDAQLAIARENGAASWTELKQRLENAEPSASYDVASIEIQGIDQVWLDCKDLEEAERFYSNLLGLAKTGEVPGQMLFFDCGGTNLLLGKRDEIRPNSILYFNIGDKESDIQSAYNQLKKAGAWVGDSPHCIAENWNGYDVWTAFFKDPSGNQLAFKCNVPL